jgi:hypothetical protein
MKREKRRGLWRGRRGEKRSRADGERKDLGREKRKEARAGKERRLPGSGRKTEEVSLNNSRQAIL